MPKVPHRQPAPDGQLDDSGDNYALPQAPSANDPFILDPTGPGGSEGEKDKDKGPKRDEDKGSDGCDGTSSIILPGPPDPNTGGDGEASGSSGNDDGANRSSASANALSDSDGIGND